MVRAVGYKILLHYFLGLHDLVLPNHSVSSIGFHIQYFFFFFFSGRVSIKEENKKWYVGLYEFSQYL